MKERKKERTEETGSLRTGAAGVGGGPGRRGPARRGEPPAEARAPLPPGPADLLRPPDAPPPRGASTDRLVLAGSIRVAPTPSTASPSCSAPQPPSLLPCPSSTPRSHSTVPPPPPQPPTLTEGDQGATTPIGRER